MTSKEINEMVQNFAASEHCWELEEFCGKAGDVCLMHPSLVHARGKNLGACGLESSIRFLSHPAIGLKEHMDLNKPSEMMSPLEYSIAHVLDSEVVCCMYVICVYVFVCLCVCVSVFVCLCICICVCVSIFLE